MTSTDVKNEIQRIAFDVNLRFMAEVFPKLEDKACIKGVRFASGHPLEITQRLIQYTQHDDLKFEKFPLIALYTDFPIYHRRHGDYHGTSLEIAIVHYTEPNYQARDREMKSFIPILHPIYALFMEGIEESSMFIGPQYAHKVTDRYFWGKKPLGNEYNDYVDAVHIEDLELIVNPIC